MLGLLQDKERCHERTGVNGPKRAAVISGHRGRVGEQENNNPKMDESERTRARRVRREPAGTRAKRRVEGVRVSWVTGEKSSSTT